MKIFGIAREENDELIKAENGAISIIENVEQPGPVKKPRTYQKLPPNQQSFCGCFCHVTKLILIFMIAMILLLLLYVPVCWKDYGNDPDLDKYHNYYPKMLQCSQLMKSVRKQEMSNEAPPVVMDTSPNYSIY